jgi:hypothetical protein
MTVSSPGLSVTSGAREATTSTARELHASRIKDSPPYLHDGRALTLEDTVEFCNLALGLKLTAAEKTDLVAFMRQL